MVIIGIDPGQTGAIASLSPDKRLITVADFQLDECGRIDAAKLWDILCAIKFYHSGAEFKVYLEKSQSMPGQGVTSMFNYGVSYGIIYGVLKAYTFGAINEISPQKWKKIYDLNSNKKLGIEKTKEDSVNKAMELFPQRADMMRRPKKNGKEGYILHHGRSDALLICEYGRRIESDRIIT